MAGSRVRMAGGRVLGGVRIETNTYVDVSLVLSLPSDHLGCRR